MSPNILKKAIITVATPTTPNSWGVSSLANIDDTISEMTMPEYFATAV